MKNKTGIFIDISLTIVSRQNKSKIQHIKFQDLITQLLHVLRNTNIGD